MNSYIENQKIKSMHEKFNIKGFWRFQDSKNDVPGILHYSPDEIILELWGLPSEIVTDEEGKKYHGLESACYLREKDFKINGYCNADSERNFLSLFNCRCSHYDGIGLMGIYYFQVECFTMGESHVNSLDEKIFSKMRFSMKSFNEWLDYEISDSKGIGGEVQSVSLKKRYSDDFEVFKIPCLELEITEDYIQTQRYTDFNFNGYPKIDFKKCFLIKTGSVESINFLKTITDSLRNFYSLLMGQVDIIDYIELINFREYKYMKNPETGEDIQQVGSNVNVVNFYYIHTGPKKSPIERDYLFEYRTIRTNMADMLSFWLAEDFCVRQKRIIELYFDAINIPNYFSDSKFLNLARSIEKISNMSDNIEKEADEITNARKIILEFLNNEYENSSHIVDYFQPKINNKNTKNLNSRLKNIFEFHLDDEIIKRVITETSTTDDIDTFISQVVDTRNWKAHEYSKAKGKAVDTDKEFAILTRQLEIIVQYIILNKIESLESEFILSNLWKSHQDFLRWNPMCD